MVFIQKIVKNHVKLLKSNAMKKLQKVLQSPPAFGWNPTEEKLLKFWKILNRLKLIPMNLSFEVFASHFIIFWLQPKMINWKGTSQLLVDLIYHMAEEGIIPQRKHQCSKIAHHFLDQKGRTFIPNNLHQCTSRRKGLRSLTIAKLIVRELLNNND